MSAVSRNFTQSWLPEPHRDTAMERLLDIAGEMFERIHSQIGNLPASIAPGSDFYGPPIRSNPSYTPTPEQRAQLQWLAGWVNLVLSEAWTHDQRREILAKILPIYKKRGTREGLTEYLKIYAGDGIAIEDDKPPIQIGDAASSKVGRNMIIGGFPPATPPLEIGAVSQVGANAIIGGFPPYFFLVRAKVSDSGPAALARKRKAITAVLDMEKPAHTWYRLSVTGPTFKLEKTPTTATATLGINTII